MELPKRKLPRLQGFDYRTEAFYYVTICTADKAPLFWEKGGLSEMGRIAAEELENISKHYEDVAVDKYIVMSNHIHGIFVIGCNMQSEKLPNLSAVIGAYKAGVSRRIHQQYPMVKVWQKSFYDTVIRNEQMYREVWKYIDGNPRKM